MRLNGNPTEKGKNRRLPGVTQRDPFTLGPVPFVCSRQNSKPAGSSREPPVANIFCPDGAQKQITLSRKVRGKAAPLQILDEDENEARNTSSPMRYFLGDGLGEAATGCLGWKISFLAAAHFCC